MSVRNFVLVSRLEGDGGTYENRDKLCLCLCAEIAFAEVTQRHNRLFAKTRCHRARKNSTDKKKRSRGLRPLDFSQFSG